MLRILNLFRLETKKAVKIMVQAFVNLVKVELVLSILGCLAQQETCLTADPGVASSIRARSHNFVEIDHEIISTAILLPSADSRRVVVSNKQNYVHKVLLNCLIKHVHEKSVVIVH